MMKNFAAIVVALLLALPARAEVKSAGPRIAYAQVPVADLDRAVKFYSMLGLKKVQDAPGATVLAFEGSTIEPQLVLLHGPQYAAYKSPIDFPAVVFVLRDLPSIAKRMAEAGFNVPEARNTAPPPGSAPPPHNRLYYAVAAVAIAKDPDGHPVELLGHLATPGEKPFASRILFTKTAAADIANAVVFYSALGLETTIDYPGEGRRFNMLFPGSEHDTRARFIINHGPRYVSYKAPDDVSRTVFAVPDLKATLTRLAEIGVQPAQAPRKGEQGIERGHEVAVVKDHEGNVVELLQ